MSQRDKTKSLRVRLLRLMGLNVFIGLVVALILALSGVQHNQYGLGAQIVSSLIHSIIYGLVFGLSMPYLAERLAVVHFPWNWTGILISLALLAALSTLAVQLSLLGLNLVKVEDFWIEFGYKTSSVFVIALIIGLSINSYERIRGRIEVTNLQLRTQELEKERSLKLMTEARLASLQSRLHPHFLFNTLNSISALILEDPLLADQIVQRLAALLRNSLDVYEQMSVTLKEEIKLATDYLEIERARYRERLSYSIDVEPGLEFLPVPPLTLQPLVENSIKFAVAPNTSGGEIRISARIVSDSLRLKVWDNGTGFTAETIPSGHGLDNLQGRLLVLLGDAAKLLVDTEQEGTTVTVSIPLNGAEVR
jgi:sensor histidine kinase YesM